MQLKSLRFQVFVAVMAAFTLASIPKARANTLAYENFSSPATGSISGSNNLPTGWGGSWFASNASNGYLFTTQNTAPFAYTGYTGSTTPAASGGNYEQLASGFGGDQTTYIQRNVDTSTGGTFGSAGLVTGTSGLIGANNTTLWGSFLYSSDTSDNTGNTTLSFSLLGGGSFTFLLSQPQPNNLVVFSINYGSNYLTNDTVTVWTNPTLGVFNGTSGGTTSSVANYSFNAFRITTTYSGGSGSQSNIDDIRFGTTVADVVPVPEPTTFALLFIGAAGALVLGSRVRALRR